jgi:hypothetical protein
MLIPKQYLHDKLILLLLSVNTFLTLLGGILVLLRLGSSGSDVYIVEYRANLGLSAFTRGAATPLMSFVIFVLLVMVAHTLLSMRVFTVRRQLSVIILAMGTLLLTLAIIVSDALLKLR